MENLDKKKNFFITIILSLTIVCNLFLGRFYENILILKVPLNHIILLIFLFFVIRFNKIYPYLKIYLPLKIYFFFLFFGLIQIFYFFFKNGIWAFRDGIYIIDSLYILVGFYYGLIYFNIKYFKKILKIIILLATIYLFLALLNIDLTYIYITSPSGQIYYLLNFVNLNLVWVWSGLIALFITKNKNFLFSMLFLALIFFSIIYYQARTTYIAILIIVFFLFIIKEIKIKSIIFKSTLSLFIFILMFDFFDIEMKGRIENFSLSFFIDHFKTLFIFSQDNTAHETLYTSLWRYYWWKVVLFETASEIKTLFFGQGFGIPLIDHLNLQNNPAREPHNMFITVFGRQGLIGLFIFCSLIFSILIRSFKIVLILKKNNNLDFFYIYLILYLYVIQIVINFIGDSILNFSSFGIPFYLFLGIIFGNSLNKLDSIELKKTQSP